MERAKWEDETSEAMTSLKTKYRECRSQTDPLTEWNQRPKPHNAGSIQTSEKRSMPSGENPSSETELPKVSGLGVCVLRQHLPPLF